MRYLVEIALQRTPTQEILELLPAEAAHGKKFDESGVREALYVAATEVKAWQIYRAGRVSNTSALRVCDAQCWVGA